MVGSNSGPPIGCYVSLEEIMPGKSIFGVLSLAEFYNNNCPADIFMSIFFYSYLLKFLLYANKFGYNNKLSIFNLIP